MFFDILMIFGWLVMYGASLFILLVLTMAFVCMVGYMVLGNDITDQDPWE